MKRPAIITAILIWGCLLNTVLAAGADYHCLFVRGEWNSADWLIIKEPRFAKLGEWIQETDCIRNRVPENATKDELVGKRADETFTSMILKDKIYEDVEIRSTLSFDDRMAPAIIVRAELDKNKDGSPENRNMCNVVIYDEGINIWLYNHADFVAGKRGWRKAAFSRFKLLSKTQYEVIVTVKKNCLEVRVGDHHLGLTDDAIPAKGYMGICGCEGVNRFYNFSLKELGAAKK